MSYSNSEYPEAELTSKLIGFAIKIFKEIGYKYPEKVYQKAFENELIKSKIKFKRESYCKITIDDKIIGSFKLDFLVDDKVVVELKVRDRIFNSDIAQVLTYLKTNKVKIGLILLFSSNGVKIKRLMV